MQIQPNPHNYDYFLLRRALFGGNVVVDIAKRAAGLSIKAVEQAESLDGVSAHWILVCQVLHDLKWQNK